MSGLLVSSSISSRTLSFIDRFTLSCIIGLRYPSFFLFVLQAWCLFSIIDVFNVAIIGEGSEVKSLLDCMCMYVEEIPLVTKKSSRSGIWFSQQASMLVFQLIEMNSFSLGLPLIILCLLLLNVSSVLCVCCCNRLDYKFYS